MRSVIVAIVVLSCGIVTAQESRDNRIRVPSVAEYDAETKRIADPTPKIAKEQFELIPFGDETPSQEEIDSQYRRDQIPATEETQSHLPDRLVITLAHDPLYIHLIKIHKCPEWVAVYYKNDTKNLIRIHRGYELKGLRDEYSEEALAKATEKGESAQRTADRRAYFAIQRKYYSRFKMLKVTKPTL